MHSEKIKAQSHKHIQYFFTVWLPGVLCGASADRDCGGVAESCVANGEAVYMYSQKTLHHKHEFWRTSL